MIDDFIDEIMRPFTFLDLLCFYSGMKQNGNQTWSYFFFGHLINFICIDLFLIGEIIFFIVEPNWDERIANLSLAFMILNIVMQKVVFLTKTKPMEKLKDDLIVILNASKTSMFKNRQVIQDKSNITKTVLKIFAMLLMTNFLFGIFTVFVLNTIPHKLYYPFDTKNSKIGIIVGGLYQNISCWYASAFMFYIEGYSVALIIYAIGLIDELSMRISKIDKQMTLTTMNY